MTEGIPLVHHHKFPGNNQINLLDGELLWIADSSLFIPHMGEYLIDFNVTLHRIKSEWNRFDDNSGYWLAASISMADLTLELFRSLMRDIDRFLIKYTPINDYLSDHNPRDIVAAVARGLLFLLHEISINSYSESDLHGVFLRKATRELRLAELVEMHRDKTTNGSHGEIMVDIFLLMHELSEPEIQNAIDQLADRDLYSSFIRRIQLLTELGYYSRD